MRLLTTKEVTSIIGRSRATLRRWWKAGVFPEPLLYKNRTLGWDEEKVKRWLKSNPS